MINNDQDTMGSRKQPEENKPPMAEKRRPNGKVIDALEAENNLLRYNLDNLKSMVLAGYVVVSIVSGLMGGAVSFIIFT